MLSRIEFMEVSNDNESVPHVTGRYEGTRNLSHSVREAVIWVAGNTNMLMLS